MSDTAPLPSVSEVWGWLRLLAGFRAPAEATEAIVVSVHAPPSGPARASLGDHPEAVLLARDGAVVARRPLEAAAQRLFDLYGPLCQPALCQPALCQPALDQPPREALRASSSRSARGSSFVVAHLGQSLDGRIASATGRPEAITGPEDMTHNHRMRALFDVVLVGGATVCNDDPQLTVRHVEGRNPVRVVLDPDRRLARHYSVFTDGLAPTLLLCRPERCAPGEQHGQAEVAGIRGEWGPAAVLRELERRALRRVFIEGGGVTVSRFLAARCLDYLQLAVSPMIMGKGRPGVDLAETLRLRPRVRRFELADDVLFECRFDAD